MADHSVGDALNFNILYLIIAGTHGIGISLAAATWRYLLLKQSILVGTC